MFGTAPTSAAGMFADDGIQPELALVIRQFNAHHDSLRKSCGRAAEMRD